MTNKTYDTSLSQPRTRTDDTSTASFRAFVTRLHFYVGLFVGPFILVAAISGLLYVLTPQLESWIYQDQLRTESTGPALSLAAQAAAARAHVGEGPRLFAVRPAIAPGHTTRVQFSEPGHGPSESRAIFVDPVTAEIRGDLIVYGTSGTLPFRTQIDYVHRSLLLGDFGRFYSELAASWLLVATLGGVLLWWWRRDVRQPATANVNMRTRRLHGRIGIVIALGLVFVGVTGLTWSEHAGGRILQFRQAVGWITPSVATTLPEATRSAPSGDHADHTDHAVPSFAPGMIDYTAQLDQVEAITRAAGILSPMIEIQTPRSEDRGWMVREYDRSWPTDVDTIAIDPRDMSVLDQTDFWTFPLFAKLIRWGIDFHMGILFGVANQLFMAAVALGLTASIVYGYRIWWLRRPAPGSAPKTLAESWTRLSTGAKCGTLVVAVALGWAMPVLGVSLIGFVAIDLVRWRLSRTS